MKLIILISTLLFTLCLNAQTVDVNGVDSNEEGTTTIEIKKGKKDELKKSEALWEIQDGTAEVEGESAATAKEAKMTWKKACDDWKKEFRNDNKENKILAINCGSSSCGGEVGQKVCTSKASYKVKSRLN